MINCDWIKDTSTQTKYVENEINSLTISFLRIFYVYSGKMFMCCTPSKQMILLWKRRPSPSHFIIKSNIFFPCFLCKNKHRCAHTRRKDYSMTDLTIDRSTVRLTNQGVWLLFYNLAWWNYPKFGLVGFLLIDLWLVIWNEHILLFKWAYNL